MAREEKTTDTQVDGNLAKVLDLADVHKKDDPSVVIHKVIDQCLMNMVFQPIVDMREGKIFAYEALCRSRVPQFENPPAMIEAASAAGRIGELGRLQRSLASKNCPDWPIFVNISPNEFDEAWLVRPDDPLFMHRQPVYLEITESVPLVFFEQCHSVLAELRQKGALLAIDDLGAGYSNLKYIADLAPDIVKLDRDLVAGCVSDGSQFELLRSIAKLCREVNAKVVAEGVETAEELEAVSRAGIEYCQGYFLGRPKRRPSELAWPASEMMVSDTFRQCHLERETAEQPSDLEAAQRRLDDLEGVRKALEKSVRKARGEVVRLRKALSQAESQNEQAQAQLADVQDSLSESETNRRRLARLFEQATLRKSPQVSVGTPESPGGLRVGAWARNAMLWAAGLAAGLGLFYLDPRGSSPAADAATVEPFGPVPPIAVSSVVTPVERPSVVAGSAAETTRAEAPPQPPVEPIEESQIEAVDVVVPSPEEKWSQEEPRVREAVERWALAWSRQDVDGYLASYVEGFVASNGKTGEVWREHRRERLLRPSEIQVDVSDLTIEEIDAGSARAEFLQTYRSDSYRDTVRKELLLARVDDGWLIANETSLD